MKHWINIRLSEEELEALIDFQRNMRDLASEDNEIAELAVRARRITYLISHRVKAA